MRVVDESGKNARWHEGRCENWREPCLRRAACAGCAAPGLPRLREKPPFRREIEEEGRRPSKVHAWSRRCAGVRACVRECVGVQGYPPK